MIRVLLLALSLLPVWWRRRSGAGTVFRNRRGGRLVLAGDVVANLSEAFRAFVLRLPPDAMFNYDSRGGFRGVSYRSPRRKP